jgi:hypothetical protein
LVTNLATLFEPRSRVTDYTVFILPTAIGGVWDLLKKLNIVKIEINNGENYIFAISIAMALLLYKKKKDDIPQTYAKYIENIYGKEI